MQGRLNDLGMLLATHAQRDAATGKFTPESHELLEDVARYVRLYHLLFWAGQVRPARGDEGVSLSVLRTEIGLVELQRKAVQTIVRRLVDDFDWLRRRADIANALRAARLPEPKSARFDAVGAQKIFGYAMFSEARLRSSASRATRAS